MLITFGVPYCREIENRLLKPYRESEHLTNQLFEKVRLIKGEQAAAKPSPRIPAAESTPESDEEGGDHFSTDHKLTVDERAHVVLQRRSTIIAVADAEMLAKYQEHMDAANRKVSILQMNRRKSRKRTPGAVWKSIFLTLLIANRMRTYINLRKIGSHSIAARFRCMLMIRNAWIRHRTRMGKRARLASYDVPVEYDEYGNNLVVPQVTDNLFNVFQYFSREMREQSREIFTRRRDGADLIVKFARLVSGASGTRGAVRVFVRRIKTVQRLVMKHLRVNQGRMTALQIVMDRVIAALAPHIFIVAAGRGLDRVSDSSKTGAVERASIELYCKTTDSLSCVRGLLSAGCHAYMRSNLHRIQTCLNSTKNSADKSAHAINSTVRRQVMLDFVFKLRRIYLRERSEKLRLEKINHKIPEVSTGEVAQYLHSLDPNSDPVLVRLLSSIGPAALLHDDSITSSSAHYAVSESINRCRHHSTSSQINSSSNSFAPTIQNISTKESHVKVANAMKTFEIMMARRNQKAFFLFSSIEKPEVVIELILRIYEKSVEFNKQEHHRTQLLMLEEYQKQQMLLLHKEEAKVLDKSKISKALL